MSEQEQKKIYSPKEAAKMLGISVDMLRQWRWQGRIEGTPMSNSTVYTLEQIQAADRSEWKRGRKPKARKSDKANEQDGSSLPVILTKESLSARPLDRFTAGFGRALGNLVGGRA